MSIYTYIFIGVDLSLVADVLDLVDDRGALLVEVVKFFFCFVRLKCGIGYLPMIFSKKGRNKSKGVFFRCLSPIACQPRRS
jgi:hypothetical protein